MLVSTDIGGFVLMSIGFELGGRWKLHCLYLLFTFL